MSCAGLRDAGDSETLSIGEVAEAIGLSASTIRAWEAAGLVRSIRDAKGNRRYPTEAQLRLRAIQRLREREKLPVGELRRRLQQVDNGTTVGETAVDGQGERVALRLKMLRHNLSLPLREVARRTGLSASHINAVEHGYSHPSVASLIKLAQAYGVNVLSFFDEDAGGGRHLVRRGGGDKIEIGNFGVSMILLSPRASQIELHLFHLAPGAGSGGSYHHHGDEFFFVLEGKLGVWLDDVDYYELEPGDCLCFPSAAEHRWVNVAEMSTRFLGGNTPPTF